MNKLLIDQYFQEIKNSLFYSMLASECSSRSLMGFTKFFNNQSLEEYLHSKRVLDHLLDRKIYFTNYNITSDNIKTEGYTNVECIKEILKESLKREKQNSENFKKIMEKIEKNKEYKHQDMITWFINEQVEEENTFQKLIRKFEASDYNVYLLDKELGDDGINKNEAIR